MEDDEPRLSGAVFLSNLRGFREVLGEHRYESALGRLAPATRREIGALVAAGWIRVSTADTAYLELGRASGRDPVVVYREVVEKGVERTLRTVWRILLRLTTDRALVSRTPMIYAKGHSVGRLVSSIVGPGRAELQLSGWPSVPELRLHGVAAGISAVLRVAGRRDVAVTFERIPDGASFEARWIP